MEIPIIYEDADIVVISKPTGIMTHPDGRNNVETVSDWFAEHYSESSTVGEPMQLVSGETINRPGIVHRLDTETSGAMILVKTQEAYSFLKESFKKHDVKKTYLAFVYGLLKPQKGIIDFPIGRSRKDFRLRSAQPKARGRLRDALTRYETLGDIGTHSFIKVMPNTGRTHQIRVHMKAVHHPVVCDSRYAPKHVCDLGFDRLGLHAYKLDTPLLNGERKEFTAPLPEDLAQSAVKFPNLENHL